MVSAAVGGEFGEEGGDHVRFAEGVTADDGDIVAYLERKGAGAALINEESIAMVEDAHVRDAAVLSGESLDGGHCGKVVQAEDGTCSSAAAGLAARWRTGAK